MAGKKSSVTPKSGSSPSKDASPEGGGSEAAAEDDMKLIDDFGPKFHRPVTVRLSSGKLLDGVIRRPEGWWILPDGARLDGTPVKWKPGK